MLNCLGIDRKHDGLTDKRTGSRFEHKVCELYHTVSCTYWWPSWDVIK